MFRAWELSPDGYATLPMRLRTTRMFAKLFMTDFVPPWTGHVNGFVGSRKAGLNQGLDNRIITGAPKLRVNHTMP